MADFQPSRQQSDLADVVEMLLDKGVVINADIAVSVGDTQLLGIQVRAAIASFDTAARYGLEFPEGTDMRRMAEEVGDPELAEMNRPRVPIDPTRSVNVTAEGEDERASETSDDGQASDDGERADASDATGSETDSDDETDTDGETDSDDESGLLGTDERGTERLGARPNPDTPTGDGGDLTGDDADDLFEEAASAVTGGGGGEADEQQGEGDDGGDES